MFCSKCGVQNEDGLNFCANCGAPLNAAPAEPVAPAAPVMPQQPVYQQPAYQPAPVKASVPGKGLGIAGMVLGIVGLVLICFGWVSIISSIVGISLSGVGMSKAKKAGVKNGMATAGLVCSCISLGLYFILFAIGFAGAAALM